MLKSFVHTVPVKLPYLLFLGSIYIYIYTYIYIYIIHDSWGFNKSNKYFFRGYFFCCIVTVFVASEPIESVLLNLLTYLAFQDVLPSYIHIQIYKDR